MEKLAGKGRNSTRKEKKRKMQKKEKT